MEEGEIESETDQDPSVLTSQGPSRHYQNDNSGKTLLVAKDDKSYPKEMCVMHPLQNVR